MNRHVRASVIIPVYNDPRLRSCLQALHQQFCPDFGYEIIVVDNGSNEYPDRIARDFPDVLLARETVPGSYAARNKGIRLARGNILAFTDSDCIPDKEWLKNGVEEILSDPGVGLVGGRIELFFREESRPVLPELYESLTYLQQHRLIKNSGFASTANMFTRSEVFWRVGMFDQELKSGGDREWGERVSASGFKLLYAENVLVRHPARSSLSEIKKRWTRVCGGRHQIQQRRGTVWMVSCLARALLRDMAPPVVFAWKVARDNRVRGLKNKILLTSFHVLVKANLAWIRLKYLLGSRPTRS